MHVYPEGRNLARRRQPVPFIFVNESFIPAITPRSAPWQCIRPETGKSALAPMVRLQKQLIVLEEKNFAPGLFRRAGEVGSHPHEILGINPEDDDIPIVLQVA